MKQAGRFDGVRRDKKSGYRYFCLCALMDVRPCDIGAKRVGIRYEAAYEFDRPLFFLPFSLLKRTTIADTLINK
jgi:hypothetical protein